VEKRKNHLRNWNIITLLLVICGAVYITYFVFTIIFPICIPSSRNYDPPIPIPLQAQLIRESDDFDGYSAVYTIRNMNQEGLVEFFEAELGAKCFQTLGTSHIGCSGRVERLARFYINIFDINTETQTTDFNISIEVKMCDSWGDEW
jgi:hypothetical protein